MRSMLCGLAVSLLLTTTAHAQATRVPTSFDPAAIDEYVAGVVAEKGITGLSLAVVRDGKIILSKGYGKRSVEAGTPVEAETPFAIGSVTKQFACAAILLLAEDGKLSVDDKVAKYFPDLTQAGEITLYQLMTHTSGYPDYYPLDFVDRRMARPIEVDALIRQYAGGSLDFPPGTRWSYSNTGFMILGRVVEKVSGQPLGEFLRARIFEPAGMKSARLDPNRPDPALAVGYFSLALNPREPAVPEASGWLYAAGGLWASAADLARWDLALMEGRILKPESLRLMTSPVPLKNGRYHDYGCGLNVRRDVATSGLILSHGGSISGFRASNAFIPRTRSAVVVLANDEQPDPGIGSTILGLLGRPPGPSEVPKVDGPSPSTVALDFFHQLQAGALDRSRLGEEFSAYLDETRIRSMAPPLKALGEPDRVMAMGASERGGLQVVPVRLTFKSVVLQGLLYRSTDGKIQQLLFEKN